MTEFSLRALVREVWDELGGDCDCDLLADEVQRRISDGDRSAALAQLLPGFSRQFVATRRKNPASLRERLERRTERVGECLLWTGRTDGRGYGAITIHDARGRRSRLVHRVAYEAFVGPIPDGHDLDHWCHSRNPDACVRPCIHIRCWNPEHMRPLTRAEHNRLRRVNVGRPRKRKIA